VTGAAGDLGAATLLRLIAQIVADESGDARRRRLTRATRPAQVPGWDSLMHARIVLALEERLQVRVDIAHTYDIDDLGGLVDYLTRLAAAGPDA